jgi:hypothetical protein
LPDLAACCITPQALELITAVGPPDCATIALGFAPIVNTPLQVPKYAGKIHPSSGEYIPGPLRFQQFLLHPVNE